MKIPTPPNGAPYYHGPPMNGMDMNPQWQGNGVVIDGGAPGNGAAYIMPHHMHQAGFIPPGGYYATGASPPAPQAGPAPSQDFSEYMWMENEEEFDKQVMQQLEEEALMEQCIQAMLADEREANQRAMEVSLEEQVSKSTLNPEAAEFIPTFSGSPIVLPSTSDQDAQTSLAASAPNAPKSVESSMSELSISQVSDAPTDSSKSSTAEIAEELCNLPLDSEKQEDTESKNVPAEATVVKSEIISETVSSDEVKSDNETAEKSETTPESKTESVVKNEVAPQPKETEIKCSLPETTVTESVTSATPDNSQQTVTPVVPAAAPPAAPAVFNYAAAARANLPPKAPSVAQAVSVAPKQDSASKESSPQPSATQSVSASSGPAKSQAKPAPKQNKSVKDTKDPKQSNTFPKGQAAGAKKSNKK